MDTHFAYNEFAITYYYLFFFYGFKAMESAQEATENLKKVEKAKEEIEKELIEVKV